MSLADGADLLFTGINFEDAAANVAEHYDIPLATLHYFPLRPNGQILPIPAGAVGPLGSDGVLVGVLAWDEEGRGRPASRTGPTEGNRLRAATDHRSRVAGNPGL